VPDATAPLPDDPIVLQQMLHEAQVEIEKLQLLIDKLLRHRYGRRSEQLSPDQLLLGLEDQEQTVAEKQAAQEAAAEGKQQPRRTAKPNRNHGALPSHLPRYEVLIDIDSKVCPCCGGVLHAIGEDRTEMLDIIPARLRVKVIRRPRYACRACEGAVVQAPAPERPIDGGMATEAMIIHVVVSKFCDGLPLYRQAQMLGRQGIALDRSTLSAWVGQACWWLTPLYELLVSTVLAADKVFADETTLPVLDPGRGKTKTGRLWCYAVDDRPWAGQTHPAAAYIYSEDRRGEHPSAHLATFRGILQVDGYAGFGSLVKARGDGSIRLAFCWAHTRRPFYEIYASNKSPLAAEVLARIGKLYEIEARIRGQPPDVRRAVRQLRSRPLVEDLHHWLEEHLPRVPGWSELAKAMRYALRHWDGLILYLDDGRLEMDTNVVERAIRPVANMRTLYPSSSSVWKHGQLLFEDGATWAPLSADRGDDPLVLQVGRPDLIRRTVNNLFGGKDTALDEAPDDVVGDAKRSSSLGHGEPFAVLFGRTVGVDAVHPAQRADTMGGPGLPLTSARADAVQSRSDFFIRPSACHAAHDGECILRRTTAMLPRSWLLHTQLRVLTSAPVYCEDDLSRRLINICDDIFNQCAYKPLSCTHACLGSVPGGGEISSQAGEVRCPGRQIGRPARLQPLLAVLHAPESRFPTLLQLSGDETIIGIAGSVAPLREGRLILGLLQFKFNDAASFVLAFHVHPLGFQRRLDGHRLQSVEKFAGDSGINASPAKPQATRQPEHQVWAVAPIYRAHHCLPHVYNRQATTAAPAGEEPRQQCSSAPPRLRSTRLAIGIGREQPLIPLELWPSDVTLMVILQQNLALLKRLAVAVALAEAAINDLRSLLAFAVGICSGVEGILQHRDHVAISDGTPFKGDHAPAVRRSWEMYLLGAHPQQNLSRATALPEPVEDLTDDFLNTHVRIEAETDFSMPAVSDRYCNAQFTSLCLGSLGIQHTGPQDAKLELADTSFHSQQQSIVRSTRVIHAIHVDHTRLNQSAQLEQVMPIAPIAREPRGVEAQNSPNLTGVKQRNKMFEAGSGHLATCRSPQIVINNLDVVETAPPGDLDEFKLAALAFEIRLDLRRRGLSNVDDRLAPQHRGGQEIRRSHRCSPRLRRPPPPTASWRGVRSPRCARRGSCPEAWPSRAL
jgi:transposase